MTLSDICASIPGALSILTSHGIDDVDTLRDVLADPVASAELARDLKAGPLAKIRKALGLTGSPVAAIVEVLDPLTMSDIDLLERVRTRRDDTHALNVAMGRVPRLVIDGEGISGISVPLTVTLKLTMGDRPLSEWPTLFRGFPVMPWSLVVPASDRLLYCPLTGEPVVDGYTTKSGLNWSGIPEDRYGLLAFLASQRGQLRQQSDKDILEAVRSGTVFTSREFAVVMVAWTGLSPAQRLTFAESVYEEHMAAPVATYGTTMSDRPERLDQALCAGFDMDGLLRLVAHNFGREAAAELPSGGSRANFALALVEWCRNRGMVPDLVNAASRMCPRREAQFRAARV